MYGFIEIRFDLTEIWTAKWHYSQVTSFQHSRCQSERPNCLNQMFKVSPFCMDTFAKSSTPLVHCSINNALIKSTPLFNQSFFQMVDVTDLAAVDSKSRSPPDWDLNCSVANPVGWWSRVSLLTAVQVSRARWARALSCWKVKKSPNTERMAGRQQLLSQQSFVGNWDLWQQLEKNWKSLKRNKRSLLNLASVTKIDVVLFLSNFI